MNNSPITPLILVVSEQNIDISKDLQTEETKTIAKLLEENNEEEKIDQPIISG